MIDVINNSESKNYFYFMGRDSRDFGLYISGYKTYNSPRRSYEPVTVPGRNGDIMRDNGRYENVSIEYTAFMYPFLSNIENFRDFIFSSFGYERLEDTYHPDEYYLACFDEALEPEIDQDYDLGQFSIKFNRKPQRFLKDGERAKSFMSSGKIVNPTMQSASPLIRVYGHGTITIGGKQIVVASNDNPYIDIDCDEEDAYYVSGNTAANCNGFITLPSDGSFPSLPSGETSISKTSGITKIEITPRWWRI